MIDQSEPGKGKKVMRSVTKESLCGNERMKNAEGKDEFSIVFFCEKRFPSGAQIT